MVGRHQPHPPIERTSTFAMENGVTLAFQLIADDNRRRLFGYAVVQGKTNDDILAERPARTRIASGVQAFDAACREDAFRMAAMLRLPGKICLSIAPETISDYRYGLHAALRSAQHWGISTDRLVFVMPVERPPLEPIKARRWASAIHNRGALLALSVGRATWRPIEAVIGYRPDIVMLDEQLTRSIDHDDARRFELSGIIDICNSTGATIIAKGVMSEGERIALVTLGIRLLHGDFTVHSEASSPTTPVGRNVPLKPCASWSTRLG